MLGEDAPFKDNAKEFYLKEYECLRKEVEWLLKDYRDLERNAVIAVGVTWAWLFDHNMKMPWWAWCFPCLFALLGGLRGMGILRAFGNFKGYISRVEDAFSKPSDPGGWEHFPRPKGSTSRFAATFWILLIGSTGVVAVFHG
jgi:hypothetical protein